MKTQRHKREPEPVTHVAPRAYFSILQAADYTTGKPWWVEEKLREGKLPYRRIGKNRVIFKRDLDALMESLPVESGLCGLPAFMDKAQKKANAAG